MECLWAERGNAFHGEDPDREGTGPAGAPEKECVSHMVSKELRQQIEDYAAQNRRRVVEDLKALVRIPSVSRRGEEGKPSRGGFTEGGGGEGGLGGDGGGGGWGTGVEAVGKISTAGEGAKKGFQGIEVCF